MCRHCEEKAKYKRISKCHTDFVETHRDEFLRWHKNGTWTLFVVYQYDDSWPGGINYVTMDTVRFCPWCGRDLQVPPGVGYIPLEDRVADLEFAVKKLEKAQKEEGR